MALRNVMSNFLLVVTISSSTSVYAGDSLANEALSNARMITLHLSRVDMVTGEILLRLLVVSRPPGGDPVGIAVNLKVNEISARDNI